MSVDILKGNWQQIAGKVRQNFADFTNDDVESIKGNYEEFEGKLRKIYGYKKAEAQEAIENFLKSEDWESLKDDAHGLKDSLLRNAQHIKERAERFVNTSMGDLKDKMHDAKEVTDAAQENVIQYVKENPVKSLGFALLAGVLAGVLFKK
jgi:uncharacterized protein YjbJ (UPF0337 family)/ElaB/YqjD/DUF883 family membrane-anchored ribosome-binding protein